MPSSGNESKGGPRSGPDGSLSLSQSSEERWDALAQERDSLRAEVTQLRQSLESIQGKHEREMSGLQEQLDESVEGRERAETQYRNLLGRVNTIRDQLGEKMKADKEELAEAQGRIEELEEQAQSMREANETLTADIDKLRVENEQQAKEIASLRDRASLSQQNWIKERDELISREAYAREEFENAKQAMQDWEVLAMDERSARESLVDRVAELEDRLNTQQEAYERAASERDAQSSTVDGLQRALQDIQDARKKELREVVENSQSQLEELRKQLQAAEEASAAAQATLESTQKELERARPFEKEVKEKNLLIGKLRHEGVILNDHLTKALRIIQHRKPEDNVDRTIVTNHFLSFLSLDRSDPKKFQVLQLIAALLGWTEEQRERAGLARPGASAVGSASSLRIPMSPFRRTPSTPALSSDMFPDSATPASGTRESLAQLWSEFLEQEAQEGGAAGSRRPSAASPSSSSRERGSSLGLGVTPGGTGQPGPGAG
ncbi:putative Golgi matrix protein [Lineolata rhizophorae]|uniref:Putative Golgi matrix protein n=1 Tax=Lineolata rhizophorae TaxID=578093 RepID=A0A6A6PBW8_9PEZI|nr:putative Golgi matrix protein [Lineolata rhizophorae]